MQIAKPVLDVQLRAFAGWSLERPVIGNGHAGCGRGALEKGRYGTSPASYLIILDREFGPAFIKICTYSPWSTKVWVNGHEWAKRQAAREGIAFAALSNGFRACDQPERLQAICDTFGPEHVQAFFDRWIT